jgi:hypothetical protein
MEDREKPGCKNVPGGLVYFLSFGKKNPAWPNTVGGPIF